MEPSSFPERELLRRVRSWQRVPRLRRDIRVARAGTTRLRLSDPGTGKFIELSELEHLIAQAADGEQSSEDLTAFARGYNPAITRKHIEMLVMQLLQAGLLEDEPLAPGYGKVIPLPTAGTTADEFAAFRTQLVSDLHRSEGRRPDHPLPVRKAPGLQARIAVPRLRNDDDLSGGTSIGIGTDPFQALDSSPVPTPGALDELDDTVLSPDGAEAFADDAVPEPVVAPAPPEPAPEPVEPPGAREAPAETRPAPAPETAEKIEAEQDAVWKQTQAAKLRWYQRTSVRLLLALAVLTTAASIIHYPLYITSECTIIPSARVYVRSPIAGVLAAILVDEGTPVKKGDVIARLDDRHLVADRRKAKAETERIEAELERLRHGARPEEISQKRAELEARRTAVEFALKEARRRAGMLQEGVGSKQAQEEAQLDLQIKQNAAYEAGAALKLVAAGTRPEEIAAREAELKRARAELEFIDQKLADMVVIRAPMDGVVLTPRFRERLNENVEAGGLVCEIADTQSVRAEIFVYEREADSIALGMPVVVKVESYPLHPFEGKVGFIAPAVESRDRINVIRVATMLDNRDHLLRQDMTGYGEVECGRKSLIDLDTRRLLRWIRVRFLL
ncbi:MAG: HlyD family efflux transporter periplasmic adaptor subunit [Deltaproteobacteria bacterium]|nr:MAG: HlyD family efflux transporter periplasmic adaptor subunit [Deltaproteobacteria bacterium]